MLARNPLIMQNAWAVWLLFGACSLAAVLTGCLAAGAGGAPAQALAMNLGAWAVGAGLAAGAARIRPSMAAVWLGLAGAALLATFVSPGLSGVHRWIDAGPIRVNAAELLAPVALVACAELGARSWAGLLSPLALTAILAFQPDISQAAAVAGGAAVLTLACRRTATVRILVGIGLGAAVVVAALRADPLTPVPEVEGVIGLAAALSPIIAALAVTTLAGAVLAPLSLVQSPEPIIRDAARALAAYLIVSALAPAAGAYPVPLVGIGVSPILGAWLGIGWLMHLARRAEAGRPLS